MPIVSKIKLPNNVTYDITDGRGMFIGTCSTVASAQIKEVSISADQNFVLRTGAVVAVKFTYTNTYKSTTSAPCKMNVNGTGDKNIYYQSTGTPNNTTSGYAFGQANYYHYYVYDGTYWVWVSYSQDANTTYAGMTAAEVTAGTGTTDRLITPARLKSAIETYGKGIFVGTCSTTSGPDLIVSTDSKFQLLAGVVIAAALKPIIIADVTTINVNSTGAIPVSIQNSNTAFRGLDRDTYQFFVYNGTSWVWFASNHVPDSIESSTADFDKENPINDVPRFVSQNDFEDLSNLLTFSGRTISQNGDLNDYTKAGVFRCPTSAVASTLSNTPITGSGFELLVYRNNTSINNCSQLLLSISTTPKIYYRSKTTSGWTDWGILDPSMYKYLYNYGIVCKNILDCMGYNSSATNTEFFLDLEYTIPPDSYIFAGQINSNASGDTCIITFLNEYGNACGTCNLTKNSNKIERSSITLTDFATRLKINPGSTASTSGNLQTQNLMLCFPELWGVTQEPAVAVPPLSSMWDEIKTRYIKAKEDDINYQHKNLIGSSYLSGTVYSEITCVAPAGEYILRFSSITSTDTDASTCRVEFFNYNLSSVLSSITYANRSSSVQEIPVTLTGESCLFRIYASTNYQKSSGDTVTVYGAMLCKREDYRVTDTFREPKNLMNRYKNILVPMTGISRTVNGVTIRGDGAGGYVVSGTATAQAVFTLGVCNLKAGVRYVITGIRGGSTNTYFLNMDRQVSDTSENINIYASPFYHTSDKDGGMAIRFYVRSGVNTGSGSLRIYPMVCEDCDYDVDPLFQKYEPIPTNSYYGKPKLIYDIDLNDLRYTGLYCVQNSTVAAKIKCGGSYSGNPHTTSAFMVEVVDVGTLVQRLTPASSTSSGFFFQRGMTSSTWGSWYKFTGTQV